MTRRTLAIASAVAVAWPLLTLTALLQGNATTAGQLRGSDDRVVLITLDGARWQEIFNGFDPSILRSTLKQGQVLETHPSYQRFWAETPEARRKKLMPFFWDTLMTAHGSVAGDRSRGSVVRVTNRHWFSYPGYAEILLGEAHDDTIASNDPVRNPYPTVLETLRERLSLAPSQVATFASWGVFNQIVEQVEGATTVDAGPNERHIDPELRQLAELQSETLPHWDNMRSDAYTIRFALRHLELARPRVLYLALGETDDWAHDGRYDRVLDAYARSDRYLEQLWSWLQNQPDYRDRTHILITTDHGRGRTPADWRDHGAKVQGSDEVWVAFVSPALTRRGQWRDHPPLTASQFAATIAAWMGVDWSGDRPGAGRSIQPQ